MKTSQVGFEYRRDRFIVKTYEYCCTSDTPPCQVSSWFLTFYITKLILYILMNRWRPHWCTYVYSRSQLPSAGLLHLREHEDDRLAVRIVIGYLYTSKQFSDRHHFAIQKKSTCVILLLVVGPRGYDNISEKYVAGNEFRAAYRK